MTHRVIIIDGSIRIWYAKLKNANDFKLLLPLDGSTVLKASMEIEIESSFGICIANARAIYNRSTFIKL